MPKRLVQFDLFEKLSSANYFQTNSRGGNAGRSFLKPFFSHLGKLFSKFLHKIVVIILRDITALENVPLSFCQS